MEEVTVTIIGAGVIGLSVAHAISEMTSDMLIVERDLSFGQETSSRNSEVIHAGLYYPQDSLKAKTCIEGKRLLYNFCQTRNVPHRKTGKLIVALDADEVSDLESLRKNALANGVGDVVLLTKGELKAMEPHVEAVAALYSPSTGILDTHVFMQTLVREYTQRGGVVAYGTEAVAVDKRQEWFEVAVRDKREGEFVFRTRLLINCAGLYADKITTMAGLKKREYQLHYCKGEYFRVHSSKAHLIQRLVYPVPKARRAGLGIHATLDLAGGMRLGPDDTYCANIDYTVDASKAKTFFESVKPFLPFLEADDLSPDMAGIRPKLQGEGKPFRILLSGMKVTKGSKA